MAINIDKIFEMLSGKNNEKVQTKGIEEAKKIKHLSVLIMPIESKSIWENCAKVLISKNDEELKLYLFELFNWFQDMNWPGAYLIYDRLKCIPFHDLEFAYSFSLKQAKKTNDYPWVQALNDFKKDQYLFSCSRKE